MFHFSYERINRNTNKPGTLSLKLYYRNQRVRHAVQMKKAIQTMQHETTPRVTITPNRAGALLQKLKK